MFKNKVEWFQLLENTDKLSELLRTFRANGVQEVSIGELTLKFTHFVHIPSEDVSRFTNLKESRNVREEDEEMLYYSSGGT
jgi:hypothetical protein